MLKAAVIIILALTGAQDLYQDLYNDLVQQATIEYLFDDAQKAAFETITTRDEAPWAPTKYLETFWLKQDPSPSDGNNELLQLFVRRVEDTYVFDQATQLRQGWKTDRGKMFLFYGSPDEIIRSTLDPTATTPFELWIYRSSFDQTVTCEIKFEEDAIEGQMILKTNILFPKLIQVDGAVPVIVGS